MQAHNLSFEIIIVDDDSPDRTAEIAAALRSLYPVTVHVRRAERGLATAVMKGFDLATGEVVVVMDADMSHPAEMLPSMVEPILDGSCGATVGSRYIEGGGCENWPWIRRVVSKGAGLLAKGVTHLSDPTSGFMAIRRSLLDHAKLNPVGWKIVLETIVKVDPHVKEIPISFADRIRGESKLSLRSQADYVRHLWNLYNFRYLNRFRPIAFCFVGLSGVVIDTGILILLVERASLDPRMAAVVAFLGAVTWNFQLNQGWTFSGYEYSRNAYRRYVSFVLACLAGLSIRIGLMHLLIRYTILGRGRGYVLASLIGIVAGTAVNYLISRDVVFAARRAE